jgi:hypothetical protein
MKTPCRTLAALACLSTFAAQAHAIAQTPATDPAPASSAPPKTFADIDLDHDGRLKRSEIPAEFALLRARFAFFDANRNGYLEADEIAAYLARSRGGEGLDMRRDMPKTTDLYNPIEPRSGHRIEGD